MAVIVVIDYGMGNLRSVAKALEHVAPRDKVVISDDELVIAGADRVVFPGQGAIRDCMGALEQRHLKPIIQRVCESKPFLGICMGMQVLLDFSEENQGVTGLGLLPGTVLRFQEPLLDGHHVRLKVPHMGWNQVHQNQSHILWQNIPQDTRFYFVHSYYVKPQDERVAGTTCHGVDFCSAIARDNLFAVQFHPEKSQKYGLQLLENFVQWRI